MQHMEKNAWAHETSSRDFQTENQVSEWLIILTNE